MPGLALQTVLVELGDPEAVSLDYAVEVMYRIRKRRVVKVVNRTGRNRPCYAPYSTSASRVMTFLIGSERVSHSTRSTG